MQERLLKIIIDYVGDTYDQVTMDMVLEINSLEMVQLVCKVENEFNIQIPDAFIYEIKKVEDFLRFIDVNKSVYIVET